MNNQETIRAMHNLNMVLSITPSEREAVNMAIAALGEQQNRRWIPVEERLPEDGETVLCTDGAYIYLTEYDADWDAAFGDMDGITAWQPLPELYKPEKGE
jgi:hypothetical protein